MKLISEEVCSAEYLVEEKNGKKNYTIKGGIKVKSSKV